MIELKKITSNNNPLIKKLKILQKKSIERKKNKSFIVEGAKEIEKAIKNKYEIESVFISDNSLLLVSNKKNILSKYHENCSFEITPGKTLALIIAIFAAAYKL